MVTNVTSLTGNGLKDWLIQRATAIIIAVYGFYLTCFFIKHYPIDVDLWHQLWSCAMFKVFSVIAAFSVLLHAWIGIWTVTTDYLKCTALRLSLQMLVAFWLFAQFIWCIMIVWGQ